MHLNNPKSRQGFTLIELLIVIAIIGILAAIAIPNFLEAQTRAKVSRVKSDFNAMSVGIELYRVDSGRYPWFDDPTIIVPSQYWAVEYRLSQLTTPIAYLSDLKIKDPFIERGTEGGYIDGWSRNQYNYRNYEHFLGSDWSCWALNSLGPDRVRNQGLRIETYARGMTFDTVIYDPTNGTVSNGDIPWTGGDTRYQNR